MSRNAWRVALHPLVFDDLVRLHRHIVDATGDPDAGSRRVSEIDALIGSIAQDPFLEAPLKGAREGFRRRHGGTDRRVTIIYAVDDETALVRIQLVAFGGQNWSARAAVRPAARSER
ncbi:type II toxin-antitoxin system RelE family toxin [Rubrimonas cliftonensis]|uniref:type II toxin-antitoxin system RelE family toxin n=1 Tax=Rubrimonas cliftonensis TaxID=89524 RepID=UPI00111495C4|nr:type II toxin-antitoxin system RelE/ParE family toxin [Rubrimonas cliftonensis]